MGLPGPESVLRETEICQRAFTIPVRTVRIQFTTFIPRGNVYFCQVAYACSRLCRAEVRYNVITERGNAGPVI